MDKKSKEMVSVVMVTFGVKDYLAHCLDSLKAQSYQEMEIIVIDNSQKPVVNQLVYDCYKDARIYVPGRNLFYAEALNKGIELSKGDFVLCLNDDVVLDKEFVHEAMRGFRVDEHIGMVSGKILRRDAKTIDSTGLFLSVWRTSRERGYGACDNNDFENEEYVFGVTGAVAFYRKKMLEAVKQGGDYFDSDYRFFYEDLDLAWRAQNLGWKGFYIPGALAYHVRGGSLRAACGVDKPYARRYLSAGLHLDLVKNRYLTIIKNETWPDFIRHIIFIVAYDAAMWGYILIFRPQVFTLFLKNSGYIREAFHKRKYLGKKISKKT